METKRFLESLASSRRSEKQKVVVLRPDDESGVEPVSVCLQLGALIFMILPLCALCIPQGLIHGSGFWSERPASDQTVDLLQPET